MVQGKYDLSGADLVECIDWQSVPSELTAAAGYLRTLLLDPAKFPAERATQLLRWTTGRVSIPCDGLKPKISLLLLFAASDGACPVAHTCSNQLELPAYTSAEVLDERLAYALAESSDRFQVE